jgi:putative ABC transport system substrate-binding protein
MLRSVATLSRPGGNITGLSYVIPETHGKCVEVLQDMLPSVQRGAALVNAADASNKQILEQIQVAGHATAVKIDPIVGGTGSRLTMALNGATLTRRASIPH